MSIRHSDFTPEEVTEASFHILDQVPAITANVDAFRFAPPDDSGSHDVCRARPAHPV